MSKNEDNTFFYQFIKNEVVPIATDLWINNFPFKDNTDKNPLRLSIILQPVIEALTHYYYLNDETYLFDFTTILFDDDNLLIFIDIFEPFDTNDDLFEDYPDLIEYFNWLIRLFDNDDFLQIFENLIYLASGLKFTKQIKTLDDTDKEEFFRNKVNIIDYELDNNEMIFENDEFSGIDFNLLPMNFKLFIQYYENSLKSPDAIDRLFKFFKKDKMKFSKEFRDIVLPNYIIAYLRSYFYKFDDKYVEQIFDDYNPISLNNFGASFDEIMLAFGNLVNIYFQLDKLFNFQTKLTDFNTPDGAFNIIDEKGLKDYDFPLNYNINDMKKKPIWNDDDDAPVETEKEEWLKTAQHYLDILLNDYFDEIEDKFADWFFRETTSKLKVLRIMSNEEVYLRTERNKFIQKQENQIKSSLKDVLPYSRTSIPLFIQKWIDFESEIVDKRVKEDDNINLLSNYIDLLGFTRIDIQNKLRNLYDFGEEELDEEIPLPQTIDPTSSVSSSPYVSPYVSPEKSPIIPQNLPDVVKKPLLSIKLQPLINPPKLPSPKPPSPKPPSPIVSPTSTPPDEKRKTELKNNSILKQIFNAFKGIKEINEEIRRRKIMAFKEANVPVSKPSGTDTNLLKVELKTLAKPVSAPIKPSPAVSRVILPREIIKDDNERQLLEDELTKRKQKRKEQIQKLNEEFPEMLFIKTGKIPTDIKPETTSNPVRNPSTYVRPSVPVRKIIKKDEIELISP